MSDPDAFVQTEDDIADEKYPGAGESTGP